LLNINNKIFLFALWRYQVNPSVNLLYTCVTPTNNI